jgi:hypothetical protein
MTGKTRDKYLDTGIMLRKALLPGVLQSVYVM